MKKLMMSTVLATSMMMGSVFAGTELVDVKNGSKRPMTVIVYGWSEGCSKGLTGFKKSIKRSKERLSKAEGSVLVKVAAAIESGISEVATGGGCLKEREFVLWNEGDVEKVPAGKIIVAYKSPANAHKKLKDEGVSGAKLIAKSVVSSLPGMGRLKEGYKAILGTNHLVGSVGDKGTKISSIKVGM